MGEQEGEGALRRLSDEERSRLRVIRLKELSGESLSLRELTFLVQVAGDYSKVGELIAIHARRAYSDLLNAGVSIELDGPDVRVAGPLGPIATIADELASVSGAWPFVVEADFVSPGRQWSGVVFRTRLELRRRQRLAEQYAAAGPLLDRVPPVISDALKTRCLQASESIRLHRNAAYSNPVWLVRPSFSIIFFPPRRGDLGVFEAPFRFKFEELNVRGSLRLSGPSDPLAINAIMPDGFRHRAELWVAVLLGYEVISVSRARGRTDAADVSPRLPGGRPQERRRGRTETDAQRGVSPYLTAVGRAAADAHLVRGHVRELPDGQQCSDDALYEARRVGIELLPGQTWVRPHARGFAPDEELTFRWTVPAAAAAIL